MGDRCTKFFHHVANFNRRVNSISSFEVKGEIVEDPAIISEEIVNLYSSLYKEPFSWRTLLDDLEFDSIFVDHANLLEKPFDEDEVTGLVQNLNGDKARGQNGFSLAFFQSCWGWSREIFCLYLMNLLSRRNSLEV